MSGGWSIVARVVQVSWSSAAQCCCQRSIRWQFSYLDISVCPVAVTLNWQTILTILTNYFQLISESASVTVTLIMTVRPSGWQQPFPYPACYWNKKPISELFALVFRVLRTAFGFSRRTSSSSRSGAVRPSNVFWSILGINLQRFDYNCLMTNNFYHATQCYRGICYGPVSVCVCLSQVGLLIK